MTKKNIWQALALLAVIAIGAFAFFSLRPQLPATHTLSSVRLGISPFQDTLLPIVGEKKGWYSEEGIKVDISILGWTEVMEALSAGHIDVAINNISSVVAVHERNPEIVYWYGVNTFDNGFALMIRPNGKLKTLSKISAGYLDHNEAVRRTAAQLKGMTIITTGKTDMEQGVVAAARRGGLDFKKDLHVIDLNPEEGLAAFLRGEGDAYIGGIPQRTRASKEGMLEMLTGADLGPPPINGFVTTKRFVREHPDALLKLLKVWFRTVNYINSNMDDGAEIVVNALNSKSGANFTREDFRRFWNKLEHYPANPREVQQLILDPTGRNYWKARWNDCNSYFQEVTGSIKHAVDPKDAFLMEDAQRAYVMKYGQD